MKYTVENRESVLSILFENLYMIGPFSEKRLPKIDDMESHIRRNYFIKKSPRTSSGSYANCIHNSKLAVKFFDKKDNEAYVDYLRIALKHDNPCFPVIHDIKCFSDGECMVVMEALKSNYRLSSLYTDTFECYHNRSLSKNYKNELKFRIATLKEQYPEELAYYKKAISIMKKAKLFSGKYKSDLGDDNILFRGTMPVLSDPIYDPVNFSNKAFQY